MSTKIGVLISILLAFSVGATLYSVSPDFRVSYETSHNELAHLYYDQKLNEHGTNYIYAYANS